ncbi:MAG TPA: helix-turn-helix domain-containing protein [Gemmatimonadaceae bacterium]|nr:helix-turn-helix domain-containing protein [Gemmatimonadaceae bacterium]
MGLVAAYLPDPDRVQHLRLALHGRHDLLECGDWGTLTRACGTEPVQFVVFDLFADVAPNFDALRVLRLRFPRVGFVAYVAATAERARELFDLGRLGVDSLVLADRDDRDPGRLLTLVEQAETRSVANLLRPALIGARATVRDAVLLAVTRAHQRLAAPALARVLGVSRRVLNERLTQAGFPPPQQLLAWGRLLVAARMLEDPQRSADSIALALDFPSGSAFRNTCQRYLGATPSEIRARGGADFAVARFVARCARGAGTASAVAVA